MCDRCYCQYNLDQLQWQWDWKQGPRLFNLYKLVCPTCLDEPQESGRTIVLPPDPIPVANARPDNYNSDDGQLGTLGYSPANSMPPTVPRTIGQNIGTMTAGNGLDSAWDGNPAKRYPFCSMTLVSANSSQNWVGKNWNQPVSGWNLILPSTVAPTSIAVSSVTVIGPIDTSFLFGNGVNLATTYSFDGSNDGANWTALSSGATSNSTAQTIGFTPNSATPYLYHRFSLAGDGVHSVAVGQVAISVSNQFPNDI